MGIQIASASAFGIGLQTSGPDGTVPADNLFHWYEFTGMPYGLTQPVANLPIEAGSSIVPRGSYKSGVWGQGQLNLIPRLSDNLGFLLRAAMGLDTVVSNQKVYVGNTLAVASYADATGLVEITTSAVHGLATGNTVYIKGATGTGSSGINGYWTVTVVDTDTFTLDGSTYVAGATVTSATVMPDLVTQTGAYVHRFTFNTSESNIPYFVVRQILEGPANIGQQIIDNRIASFEFNVPATGPLTATMAAMGRVPDSSAIFVNDVSGWTTDYDDEAAFGLSVDPQSLITIDNVDLQCTGLTFAINNNLLPPDQARIIGSQTPLDFPVLSRAITMQCQVFVSNYDLYRSLFTNSASGTQWSTTIKRGDINLKLLSPQTFTASSTAVQFLLQMMSRGNNVEFSLPAPLPQTANQPIMMTINANFYKPTSGSYAELRLHNTVSAAYAAGV